MKQLLTTTLCMELDVDLVGTELGNAVIKDFNTLANPNFPLVNSGLEMASEPKVYEYFLNCVNEPQSKIDAVMNNIQSKLKEA